MSYIFAFLAGWFASTALRVLAFEPGTRWKRFALASVVSAMLSFLAVLVR